MSWIRTNLDRLLLAVLSLLLLVIGFRRLDYAGDGLRHLQHIIDSNYPAIGEPRWLLFPALLFCVLKPLVAVGLVQSVSQAAKAFCIFNVICGVTYLVCLRLWLSELTTVKRSAVLLLVAGSQVFLTLATDTIEPTVAVSIAIVGMTFGRFKDGLSVITRLTITAVSFAFASLFYQGILFSFCLLPAIFPLSLLVDRKAVLRIIGSVVTVPLVTILILAITGDTARNSARRFLQGEANTASSRQYSQRSLKNVAGVLVVGPAYAFASIPKLRGLTGSVKLLSNLDSAMEGISGVAPWCCASIAILYAIGRLIIKRHFNLIFAFAGIMALPLIRMSQYSYLKYYVLLPILVVLVVPRLGLHFIYPAVLGAVLLVSNTAQIHAELLESESLRFQISQTLYPKLPEGTCLLTRGWGPPIQDWRGYALGWLNILNAGNADTMEEVGRVNGLNLQGRLKNLFCNCPAVVTDSFIARNRQSLEEELSYFHVSGIPLSRTLLQATDSSEVFHSQRFTLFRYSAQDQQNACKALE